MQPAIDPAVFTLLEDIVAQAKARGATDAVAVYSKTEAIHAETRGGELLGVKFPAKTGIGIRVLFNQKSGAAAVTMLTPKGITAALDAAIANAQVASDNPYAGLAAPDQVPQNFPDQLIYDPAVPTETELIEQAKAAEAAALAFDPRVQPGDKSFAGWERETVVRVASNGFRAGYVETGRTVGTVIVAETDDGLETSGDATQARFASDLRTPGEVGRKAAQDLLAKLGAEKPPMIAEMPVVFSPDAARQLVGAFAQAVEGNAIARGQTFLKGKLNQQIFPSDITITDDPGLAHGMGSTPFDAEGIVPQTLTLVENGVLKGYLLNLEAARQLGLETNGHARSSTSAGITNLSLTSSCAVTPDQLIAGIQDGFYVTEIQGHGAHIIEGEFSQAARGRWIKDGQLAQPITEATIAGRLADMFGSLQAANDVDTGKPESRILVPTIRVGGMTVGG